MTEKSSQSISERYSTPTCTSEQEGHSSPLSFSNDDQPDLVNSKSCSVENEDLDFMTALLEKGSQVGSATPTGGSEEEGHSALLDQVKQMEKEIIELRQKVKDNASSKHMSIKHPVKSSTVVHQPYPGSGVSDHKKGKGGLAEKVSARGREEHLARIETEAYSGLKIRNPLISSDQMDQRMEGRSMVKIKNLSSRVKFNQENDWVTIGVLVDKLPPRDTVKGKKYTIWKLSDLSSQRAVISLFVFSSAFQTHWKTSLGMILAILNPCRMPDKQGDKSQQCWSVENHKKIMIMGISQDYTTCRGITKSGKRCVNFASLTDGGYCDYHLCKAYDFSRSHRMECQAGYGPSRHQGNLKDKLFKSSKTELYYYGGKTFTPDSKKISQSSKKEPGKSEITSIIHNQSIGARMLQHQNVTKNIVKSRVTERSPSELLSLHRSTQPLLGRGAKPGESVPLSSFAKMKAINTVQKNGLTSPSSIISRVNSNRCENKDKASTNHCSKEGEIDCLAPVPKKLKVNPEINLLSVKSAHDWVNREAEFSREVEYFDRLEKREMVELKKANVKELKITLVHCKECKYTAESPGQFCIKKQHVLFRFKSLKRAFSCKNCSEKTFTYDSLFPVGVCKKCGGKTYEQASVYREQKCQVLESEQLLLRGVEENFLH